MLIPARYGILMGNLPSAIKGDKGALSLQWIIEHNALGAAAKVARVEDCAAAPLTVALPCLDLQITIEEQKLSFANDGIIEQKLSATHTAKVPAVDLPVAIEARHGLVMDNLQAGIETNQASLATEAIIEKEAILLSADKTPSVEFPRVLREQIALLMFDCESIGKVNEQDIGRELSLIVLAATEIIASASAGTQTKG